MDCIDAFLGLQSDQAFRYYQWRGPVGCLWAVKAPAVNAGSFVEAERIGFAIVFHLHCQSIAGHYRGTTHAQTVTDIGIVSSEAAQPLEVSIQIQADDVI